MNRRIVVTGASGNVGTSVVRELSTDPAVGSIIGIARRRPEWSCEKLTWEVADLADERTDLGPLLGGADVVIHLAWMFQPARDPVTTWRTNVLGGIRLFDAVARAGVPSLVYASSVGAYSPGPKDRKVTEDWPTHGWPAASYPREKSYLERVLDTYERDHPEVRVVRMRPTFLFKRESASEQRRLFAGPLVRGGMVRFVPVVPDVPGLRLQALHTDDAARAYRLAALGDIRGPVNLATDPVLDAAMLAEILGARVVKLPAAALRGPLAAAWRLHATPASPDLFDAALRLPLLDATRAHTELGWQPDHDAAAAVSELLAGMRDGAGMATPPLTPDRRPVTRRKRRAGPGSLSRYFREKSSRG
ncbi:NAD-dependent epimerase/dehydratase family protein [Actinophytocola sp.]|uniref:NAD-dependent epimerase/dehydratase family protein n=1 Tax=Actinophytocola sp. TaxID=1872138 RepID=UPI003D6AC2B2